MQSPPYRVHRTSDVICCSLDSESCAVEASRCGDFVMAMHRKSQSREVEEWRPWTSLISQLSWLPSFLSSWPFRHPSQPSPQFLGVPYSLVENLILLPQEELTDVHLHLIFLLLTLVWAQGSTLQVSLNTSLLGIILFN
jgi:hypothetical protein